MVMSDFEDEEASESSELDPLLEGLASVIFTSEAFFRGGEASVIFTSEAFFRGGEASVMLVSKAVRLEEEPASVMVTSEPLRAVVEASFIDVSW